MCAGTSDRGWMQFAPAGPELRHRGNAMLVHPLPYLSDSCEYFARLRHLPGAVFLDSARPHCGAGRFDLMAASPLCELRTRGSLTHIASASGVEASARDPFELLDAALDTHLPRQRMRVGEWPFSGGAIGFFSYELGRRMARLPVADKPGFTPQMQVGIYPWALMQDHDRRQCALIFSDSIGAGQRQELIALSSVPAVEESTAFRLESNFDSNLDREAYARAFARIQRYILDGDCYQVNLAQRLTARCSGDPWHAYRRLRARMASPFSAFMTAGEATVLSFSPERFLHITDGRVETRPIKGTMRRATRSDADQRQVERLLASAKDRAENIMIVDLMRNDLGRTCRTGSVRVEKLCGLESYANVHHLVSVVTGQIAPGRTPLEVLANCFPGGSITGAPKIRAMQIIDELEPDARSVYCGSIGYVSASGTMDTSIAIRTLVHAAGHIHSWGGGGIVADSDCETEYRESLLKIEPLLNGLLDCAAQPALRDRAGSLA